MTDQIYGMKIRCAAIMTLDDKKVYTGPHHGSIIQEMASLGIERLKVQRAEQGFVTYCGLFVRRKPALLIAEEAGQLRDKLTAEFQGLCSEDLKESGYAFPGRKLDPPQTCNICDKPETVTWEGDKGVCIICKLDSMEKMCEHCGGSGVYDSGAQNPDGSWIDLPCGCQES